MSSESSYSNKDLQITLGFLRFNRSTFFLGLILLLGIALRVYDLGNESYWIDEMSTVLEGQQSVPEILLSGRLDQPPAYYLPFHFWIQIFGTNEVGTRSFAVLTGIGAIGLLYMIGQRLFGKEVGLLSAFLMTIAEFQIYHSQSARFYSFFEFMTLLSFLLFIIALKSRKLVHLIFYGLASVIMVYSHAYGLFILAAQNLFILLQLKKYKKQLFTWTIVQVVIVLAVVPYFYPLIFNTGGVGGALDANIGGLTAPDLLDPLRSAYRSILSPRRERTWETMFFNYFIAVAFFVTGLVVYVVKRGVRNWVHVLRGVIVELKDVSRIASKLLLVGCWYLCPIMLPFILSFVLGPMYQDHYTISAAPALYLMLALGIFSFRKVVPLIVSYGVLAILILPSLGHYYVTDVHHQWIETAQYVEANSDPNEVVVFAPDMGIGTQQITFNWYYQGELETCGLNGDIAEPSKISEALTQCISGHNRFWVVMPDYEGDASVDRYRSFFLESNKSTMKMIEEERFVGISVHLFESIK